MASYTEKDKEGYKKYLSDRDKIIKGLDFITWNAISFEEYCKYKTNPYQYLKTLRENFLNGIR